MGYQDTAGDCGTASKAVARLFGRLTWQQLHWQTGRQLCAEGWASLWLRQKLTIADG